MTTNYEAWAQGWKAASEFFSGEKSYEDNITNPYDPKEKPVSNYYYYSQGIDAEEAAQKIIEILEKTPITKRVREMFNSEPSDEGKEVIEEIESKRKAKKRRQEERNSKNLRSIMHVGYANNEQIRTTNDKLDKWSKASNIQSLISLREFYISIGEVKIADKIKREIIALSPYVAETFEEHNE